MPPHQDTRWKQRFQNFQKAHKKLVQALNILKPDEVQEQGIIQCFECNFELSWKVLQDYLTEEKGHTGITGPRPVIEKSFQDGVIDNGVKWMGMLKSRNMTSHLYDEKEVQIVLKKIKMDYFGLFQAFHSDFEKLL